MTKIAIIIPTFNRKELLASLLADLQNQALPEGVHLLTIVVVDGSTDGTAEVLQNRFPEVQVIHGPGNWWYTRCLNEGCRLAVKENADFFLTMNDDCRAEPEFVGTLLRAHKKLAGEGIVGAATIIKAPDYRISFSGAKKFNRLRCRFIPYIDNRVKIDPKQLTGLHPSYSLMTRGLLCPTEIGKKVNFFDEVRFPQYGSDEDFALRVIKAGYKCAVTYDAQLTDNPLLTSPGSAVVNPRLGGLLRSFFNKYSVNSLRKTANFYRRHGYWPLLPFFLVYFVLGTTYAAMWKYRKSVIIR